MVKQVLVFVNYFMVKRLKVLKNFWLEDYNVSITEITKI